MEYAQSFLQFHSILDIEGSSCWIEYGFEHSSDDWTCKYCQSINFNYRDACFKCFKFKSNKFEGQTNDGRDDVSNLPTRFLLISNLDSDMTPQKVNLIIVNMNLKNILL